MNMTTYTHEDLQQEAKNLLYHWRDAIGYKRGEVKLERWGIEVVQHGAGHQDVRLFAIIASPCGNQKETMLI